MAKKVEQVIKLQIPAGQASPAPPVGPILGQAKVNIMDFCNKFNEATKNMEKGLLIPVVLRVYVDKSFDFVLKKPPVAELLKRAAGIDRGSGEPHIRRVGKVSKEQLRRIAELKMSDLNTDELEAAMRTIAGTARQMGIEVVEG
ncbi:TPA: 50S ribosomal protein L11 [Candidatus Bipolaricaulota bacterium]|nr:50S ribosomal protein L11 [Candidatus Bipolaricaulota bacterium]